MVRVLGFLPVIIFCGLLAGCAIGDGSSSLSVPAPSASATGTTEAANAVGLQTLVVPGARWGGSGVNMVINEGGATLEAACIHAHILQTIKLDANNRFEAGGIYAGVDRHPHPAQFIGRVDNNSLIMALSILLTDRFTNQTVGSFDLEYSRYAPLKNCAP